MWKVCVACAFIALITGPAVSGEAPPSAGNSLSSGNGPQFRCQLGQRLSTVPDSARLIVAMSVPYDNLIFLRTDSGFASSFEVAFSIFRDGGPLVAERVSNVTAATSTYRETNSRTKNALHVEEFHLAPGKYRARVTLTADRESGRRSKWEGEILLEQTDPLLRVSDVYWVAEDSTLADLGIPRVVEAFSTRETDAKARIQMFSTGMHEIRVIWSVIDDRADTVQSSVAHVMPIGEIQIQEFVVNLARLHAKTYTLRVELDGNGRHEVRTRAFGIRLSGLPSSITNLDLAIRQLKYVASAEENSKFRQARPDQREALFREFWARRDPTPGSEENELLDEYYRRIEYANDKYSTNRPGWESDRGRIYILYGEPTDIERHPFEPGSRPYEIWFYSQIARRFVFVDYTGFGDYTLVGNEFGY